MASRSEVANLSDPLVDCSGEQREMRVAPLMSRYLKWPGFHRGRAGATGGFLGPVPSAEALQVLDQYSEPIPATIAHAPAAVLLMANPKPAFLRSVLFP